MDARISTTPQGRIGARSPRNLAIMTLGVVSAFLIVIQVIPYGRNHVNPAVVSEPTWDSPQTKALFFRACGDCHSNQTNWPWYTNVAPISWLAAHDVSEGREVFNVSNMGQPKNKAEDASETIQKNQMPPWFYLPTHPEANLTSAERQQLINGLNATFGGEGGRANPAAGENGENPSTESESDND